MTAVEDVYTLTITGTTTKMTGLYRCVATNKMGTAEHSAMITISDGKESEKPKEPEKPKVQEKKPEERKPEPKPEKPKDVAPTFTEVYQEMTILEKQTLTLAVKLTGQPKPTVEWFR